MSKKCTPLWREAHFEVNMCKTPHVRWDVEKVHAVVARSTFRSQNAQNTPCTDHFWALRSRFAWQAQGIAHLVKSEKNVRVLQHFQNDGRRGTFEEDLQNCIFRGRRSTRDMFIRDVRRSGRWFPERGCILEHQIFRFVQIILRDKCSTSYDLASIFRGRRSTLDRWSGKSQDALVRGRQLCTQLSIFEGSLAELFHFWCCHLRKLRKSRRLVSFLMLHVKFKTWGSLAELFSFWMLSSSKTEEVSQNSFVFKLADRQIDNWIDR